MLATRPNSPVLDDQAVSIQSPKTPVQTEANIDGTEDPFAGLPETQNKPLLMDMSTFVDHKPTQLTVSIPSPSGSEDSFRSRTIYTNRFEYDYEDYLAFALKYSCDATLTDGDWNSLNVRDKNFFNSWLDNISVMDNMVTALINRQSCKNLQDFPHYMGHAYKDSCELSSSKWAKATFGITTGIVLVFMVFLGLQAAFALAAGAALTWALGSSFLVATTATAATATASILSSRGTLFGNRKFSNLHAIEDSIQKKYDELHRTTPGCCHR